MAQIEQGDPIELVADVGEAEEGKNEDASVKEKHHHHNKKRRQRRQHHRKHKHRLLRDEEQALSDYDAEWADQDYFKYGQGVSGVWESFKKVARHCRFFVEDESEEDGGDEEKEPYVNILKLNELWHLELWRGVVGEFMATMFFVGFSILGVLATVVIFKDNPAGGHAWIILYHMCLILVVIYAFGPISGAHFNPAVSITVLCCRRITLVRCFSYVAAQLVGAIVGAAFAKLASPSVYQGTLAQPMLNPAASAGEGVFIEFFTTLGLLFGSFATAFDPRGWGKLGPLAIAVIAGINIHAGSIVSGPAMNPARAFGPAVINWNWDDQWVYWAGGVLGGVVGGVTYETLFMAREEARPKGIPSTSGDNHYHREKKNQ